jgi:putative oxidoreductase
MFRKLIQTNDDIMLALLRIALGVVFFAHGAQKVLGWFGGPGYSGAVSYFTHNLGVPVLFAVLAILAEFLGSIGLIIGLFSRVAAFAIAVDMAVALFRVHLPNGFFMNWSGIKAGEGFEFHLLAIAAAAMIAVRGSGAISFDRALERQTGMPVSRHPYPEPLRG